MKAQSCRSIINGLTLLSILVLSEGVFCSRAAGSGSIVGWGDQVVGVNLDSGRIADCGNVVLREKPGKAARRNAP